MPGPFRLKYRCFGLERVEKFWRVVYSLFRTLRVMVFSFGSLRNKIEPAFFKSPAQAGSTGSGDASECGFRSE